MASRTSAGPGRPRLGSAAFLCVLALAFVRCSSGPAAGLDPDSRTFYETARLIMSGEEKDIFAHLPDEAARREFIQEFWDKRDPDPGTPENEFKTEFYNRVDYANRRFREGGRGWNTDRGRIYIYLGPPDKAEEFPSLKLPGEPKRGPVLWWVYYRYNLGFQFIDQYENGKYVLGEYEGEFNLALKQAELGYLGRTTEDNLRYQDFEFDYDRARGEGAISLPVKAFRFKAEDGLLKAELNFTLFIYDIGGPHKQKVERQGLLAKPEDEVAKMKRLAFTFPLDIAPGNYYVDIIVTSSGVLNKTRKIFKIKV